MPRKFLYSRLGSAVILILAFFAVAVPRSGAQGRPELKRPEEVPQEKPPEKKKKGKDPRAVGVLQLNGAKGTLVPVAILIDGRFYDASAYKADPVPMALESGTVYEAERAGESQGLFTVIGALHSKNAGSSNPWVGTGSFLPNGAEAPTSTHKAENVPVGLDNSDSDAPPRLTRRAVPKPAGSGPDAASTAPTPPATDKQGAKETSTQPASPPPSQPEPAGKSSGQDAQKAPASGTAGQTTPAAPASATTGQESENYYRPTLRRGKPTQPAPPDDDTTSNAPRPAPSSSASATTTASGGAAVQWVPAISDAGGPGPQSYKFFWKTGEEEERRSQMLALAADEVRAYAAALIRNHISANPPAKTATAHKAPAKPVQPVFENVQFRGFDLWLNNQPVMVLSAEAHFPAAPGAAATPDFYSVALVARTDNYGNLRKLYSGVTDKFHLDVTPRLELIDAVDADGDGRAELLFHETADVGSGYLIYRATADKLWKMFDSLNAE
ncbi:MAG: hypothetical protein WAM78_20855 [Candidatus Sulfotelmatobacter sp.]